MLRVNVCLEDQSVPKILFPGWCIEMLLQYFNIRFFHHGGISFMKYNAATPILHSLDGGNSSLFPSNVTMVLHPNSSTLV